MNVLKLSVSLPDETHPDMEVRLSADDSSCDVVIALPVRTKTQVATQVEPCNDDYVLGGYAGI